MVESLGKLVLKKAWIFWSLILLIMLWGLYLRFDLYLFNRSIWYDEAALWYNIKYNSLSGLFGVLKYNQGAPIGFLLETKALVKLFGDSEYVLRFIPFFAGVTGLFVFFWFSSQFLKTACARLFALLLFAVNTNLIFYSQEFKQYSSDVLIAMLLVVVAIEFKLKKPVLTGIFFALCMWYSHPAIFVAAGIWAAFLIRAARHKKYKNFAIFTAINALNAVLHYFVSLRHLQTQQYLNSVWYTSFINKDFSNFWDLLLNNLYFLFQPINIFAHEQNILTPICILALCIFGAITVYKQDRIGKFRFSVLVLPYAAILLAAYLHIYPYYDRVTLFLAPFFIVLAAKIFDKFIKFPKTSLAIVILCALLFIKPTIAAQKHMKNMPQQDRTIFKEFMKRYKPGQIVVLNPISALTFKYYEEQYGFSSETMEEKTYKNQIEYVNFLLSLDTSRGYWFYTTNMFENYDTKDLIEFWGKGKSEFFHYSARKSDLYYVK